MQPTPPRGKLKVFLGYAAGVGKTYQMLSEAQDLHRKGQDVVIGYFEPHGRQDTIARTEGLETIPRRRVEYRGTAFEEMDTAAVLARRPAVCVVDEFPHTNVPGSERSKRWQDVDVLLDAGIDVLTTMNIQHLESLNDHVWQISGVRVRETIPDWVVQQADQVVMVDLPPEALLNRLLRGVVYAPDKAKRAMENFFQESTLVALRELALRQAAHEVEARHDNLPAHSGANPSSPARVERILIHVTPQPSSAMVIRRGKRVADYLHADCFAVAVHEQANLESVPAAEREALERHLNFARNLHIEARLLQGDDLAETLLEFARLNGVTQLFLARPAARHFATFLRPNLVHEVVALARDMQVTIVAERKRG
jgi:two-component system, OmpR family, sensor histidine kinase KdpD